MPEDLTSLLPGGRARENECEHHERTGVSLGVELPMYFLGRRIRPFSLALLLATLVVVYQYEIMAAWIRDR
jgi:hypothetical protein